jgi:hypothetical protein
VADSFCNELATFDSILAALNYHELPAPVWRGLDGHSGRYSERGVHKLRNAPSPVRNAYGLRRGGLEGFVGAAKVVVGDVQRDRRAVVVQLLGEAVPTRTSQPVKASVLPLDYRAVLKPIAVPQRSFSRGDASGPSFFPALHRSASAVGTLTLLNIQASSVERHIRHIIQAAKGLVSNNMS